MTTFTQRVLRLKVGSVAQTATAGTAGQIVVWRRADDFGVYYHAAGTRRSREVASTGTADEAVQIASLLA